MPPFLVHDYSTGWERGGGEFEPPQNMQIWFRATTNCQFAPICRNSPQFTAIHHNPPQFTAIHPNSPQFTAIRRNLPQFSAICRYSLLNCCKFCCATKQIIANWPQFAAILHNLPHFITKLPHFFGGAGLFLRA